MGPLRLTPEAVLPVRPWTVLANYERRTSSQNWRLDSSASTRIASTGESTCIIVYGPRTEVPAGMADSEYLTCAGPGHRLELSRGQPHIAPTISGSSYCGQALRTEVGGAPTAPRNAAQRTERCGRPTFAIGTVVLCLTQPWTTMVSRYMAFGRDVSRETLAARPHNRRVQREQSQ